MRRFLWVLLILLIAVPARADLTLTEGCQDFTSFEDWTIITGDVDLDPPHVYMEEGLLEMSYDLGRNYALERVEIAYEADESTAWRLQWALPPLQADIVDPAYNLDYQVEGTAMLYPWEGNRVGDTLTLTYTGEGETTGLPITGITLCVADSPQMDAGLLALIQTMYEPLGWVAGLVFGFSIALVILSVILAILS